MHRKFETSHDEGQRFDSERLPQKIKVKKGIACVKYIYIYVFYLSENSVPSKACCIRGYDSRYVSEVCFGGMIRGMIRPHNSHSLFLKGPTGPWHSKARFRHDSGVQLFPEKKKK